MSDIEELTRLARRVKAGVLDAFANKRDAILDLMDEKSVIVGAGSNVFNGRAAYESRPPNPPGILTRNVTASVLLGELCDMLPDQFVRANRFYVVNVRFVQGVGRDGILFSSGEQIPIPERRVKEIQLEIASAVTRNFS